MTRLNSPDGLPPLRDVIAAYGLRAKKSLSQNFILDLNLTRRIARAAGPLDGRWVLEVGPGPGGLTRALLLEGAEKVIAVERDQRCRPALDDIADHYPGRLVVHEGDAVNMDWQALLKGCPGKAIIAANLPYAIATVLLVDWLEAEPWPPWWDRMALMFQREVGERLIADPGSKAYGRLAVLAQWRTEARVAMTLKPSAFVPPPKVDSSVVVLTPRSSPQPGCSVAALARVTAAAFGQRRKMLRSSLKTLTPFPELLLRSAGLEPNLRAEQVPVEGFARLAQVFGREPET